MKKIYIVIILGLLLALPASATVIRGGNEYNLNKGEIVEDNLYVAAGTAMVSGDVRGDLIIVSGTAMVAGLVAGDVQIAGGTVDLTGNVLGDVRVVGGTVNLSGNVGGEFSVAGGTVNILSNSEVKEDFNAAGGNVIINGVIGEDLFGKFGTLTLNGFVGGNVDAEVYEKISLGQNAQIGKDFIYSAPKQISLNSATVGGKVDYTKIIKSKEPFGFGNGLSKAMFGALGVFVLIKAAIVLVTALLAVYVLNKFSRTVVKNTLSGFWHKLVVGLVTLIVVPIVSFILLSTVIGAVIGLGLIFALILFGLISWVYAVIVLGAWLIKSLGKKKEYRLDWLTVLIGLSASFVLSLVPFAGWLFTCIFVLATFGSIVHLFYSRLWVNR